MRILTIGFALSAAAAASAQGPAARTGAPVRYEVSFDNAVHHEAQIAVTFRDVPPGPLRVQMSRSSPGRYAIHEFAKNVYSVSAADGKGRPLPLGRTDPYGWTVAGHDGTVTVRYTLYADRADGTYSQIDATHAHLNMPATFMWASGFDHRPIEVRFRPLDRRWKVATQLAPARERNSFRAPNLQYFLDSPTELSDHELREWKVADEGGRYTIRLAVHHNGSDEDVDRYAAKARKVVDEHIKLWGDVPNFDFGSYTFLADYVPHATSDGMEHRNSTYITDPRSLRAANFEQIQTLSHEFFHAWNVERLRPAELEPFDFTRANPTPSLWFAEGFTSYYGPLLVRRAGESSVGEYLQDLSGTLSGIVNSPGRRYGSPQEMSLRAPFVDAAASIDPTSSNIFTSYYPYGGIIGLALDLTMRQRFPGRSLDDLMRHLWRKHGAQEIPFRPADLRTGLAEVTGDAAFANEFFRSSIDGSALPDFRPLLAAAGLQLRAKAPGRANVGPTALKVDGQAVTLDRDAAPGTALYAAGVARGDEIVSLGDAQIDSEADWKNALGRQRPGDQAEIRFIQRGRERRARLTFAADPTLEIVTNEAAGLAVTPAQRAFRQSWLGAEALPSPR